MTFQQEDITMKPVLSPPRLTLALAALGLRVQSIGVYFDQNGGSKMAIPPNSTFTFYIIANPRRSLPGITGAEFRRRLPVRLSERRPATPRRSATR
jgi:hypothetical protein